MRVPRAQSIDHVLRAHAAQTSSTSSATAWAGRCRRCSTALRPEPIEDPDPAGGPHRLRAGGESLLNLWTDRRYFDVDAFIDAYGNCPAWFLQSCFLLMNPVQNFLEKDDRVLRADGRSAQSSPTTSPSSAGSTTTSRSRARRSAQFVKNLYQRNELVRGELRLGERRVDLGRITCPLLLLTAKNDHLVAPPSTEGIRPHVGRLTSSRWGSSGARRPGGRRRRKEALAGGDGLGPPSDPRRRTSGRIDAAARDRAAAAAASALGGAASRPRGGSPAPRPTRAQDDSTVWCNR